MKKEQCLELHPELVNYWAEHGPEIQQQHAERFLVLVLDPEKADDVKQEYYPDRDSAIARSRELGSESLFIAL